MGKCDICGKDGDLDWLGRCEPCFREYVNNVPDSHFRPNVKVPGYTVTAAHMDDIKRRRIDSDGHVYRDRGRKSIVIHD